MDTTPESRSALRRGAIIAACVLAGLMTVWLAAWGIDTAITGDSTRRNVAVLDASVGGLDPQQLAARIDDLARSYDTTAVEVQAPGVSKSTDAATAGLSLDVDATLATVDAVDNDVSALARPVVWLTSWFTTTHVPAVMRVDESNAGPVAAGFHRRRHHRCRHRTVGDCRGGCSGGGAGL